MEEFKLTKLTKEGAQLLREVTEKFQKLGLDTSKLPKTFPDDSGKIKLVFVGQYGAGKSSIIKMLTGADVEIGADITTQNTKVYEWNGLEIIDTPGIHTELRKDHDKITYEQIDKAALLIFVVTNEGFSQRMGEHFRELAINRQRAANMVLVVNKMDRTLKGNTPEQQKIIYEDLKEVTAPYDPKDLYLSFLDTTSYFKALEETDERRKIRRLEKSGYDQFVKNLNRFVEKKSFMEKINTSLNTLAGVLREASENDTNSNDVTQAVEIYRQEKKILAEGKANCLKDVQSIVNECKSKISQIGRDTALMVTSGKDKDAAEQDLKTAQTRINYLVSDYQTQIADTIQNFVQTSVQDMQVYEGSHFVQQVNTNIKNVNENNIPEGISQSDIEVMNGKILLTGAAGLTASSWLIQNGAQFAAQFATPASKIVTSAFGNSMANLAEKSVEIFGGAFTKLSGEIGAAVRNLPFFQETVFLPATTTNKVAQVFTGNGSKALGASLGVITLAVSGWMLYKNNKQAEEREKQLYLARQRVINSFEGVADAAAAKMNEVVRQFMNQNIEPVFQKINNQIREIETQQSNLKNVNVEVKNLLNRTQKLIGAAQN